MKTREITALVIGIPSFIYFGYNTNSETAIALFGILFANNLSQQQIIIDKMDIVGEVVDDIIKKYLKH